MQSNIQELQNCLEKYLNPDQLECLKKGNMKGSLWSDKTLVKAYKIRLTCGSSGYNTVRELGQPLPAERTLYQRIEHIKFTPGILHEVLTALKTKVEMMGNEYQKECCILIDEMAILPKYEFDASLGMVIGTPTIPASNGNFDDRATHGLVYMLAGISNRWKQVVGYQFTGNSFNAEHVKADILTIISHNMTPMSYLQS